MKPSYPVGTMVRTKRDVISYCDEYGSNREASKGDLVVIREASTYHEGLYWCSHKPTGTSMFGIKSADFQVMLTCKPCNWMDIEFYAAYRVDGLHCPRCMALLKANTI